MKRKFALCAAALCLTMALAPTAVAAELSPASDTAQVCYPTSVTRSEDGTEIRKYYDHLLHTVCRRCFSYHRLFSLSCPAARS